MARRTSQGGYGWGSTLPSGTAQPDLPPVEAWGGEQPTRQIPLTQRRMVLYATQPKTLCPADPCNKVAENTYYEQNLYPRRSPIEWSPATSSTTTPPTSRSRRCSGTTSRATAFPGCRAPAASSRR